MRRRRRPTLTTLTNLTTAAAIALALTPAAAAGRKMSGPTYANDETARVVTAMVEAHGGMERWRQARTLNYDNVFFNPMAEQMGWSSPWWVSREVIDLKQRRAYHDWPLEEAQLTFDGEQVWTLDWKAANMPNMQAMMFFYFAALPFLTQDAHVRLGAPGMGRLPGYEQDFVTVLMEFTEAPTVGKTARDSFRLFIDPESHRLRAYEYRMGFGAMLDAMGLPPEQETFGPMLRIHDRFTTVDGLVFPAEMHTMAADGSTTYGHHVLSNYALDLRFDAGRMKMPKGAVVDDSMARRASR